MSGDARKRPWLAAALSVVYPGLGHLYLRAWFRAALWITLVYATVAAVVPETAIATADGGGAAAALDAALRTARNLPTESSLSLFAVSAFSVIDAYWLALRRRRRQEEGTADRCPDCGREVEDEDLAFCQWCAAPLNGE